MDDRSVWLAFRQAQGQAEAHEVSGIARAAHAWADSPSVRGLSSVGAAVQVASRCGVGALFLDAVGDVAEATALEKAEVEAQEPATPEDEAWVSWIVNQVKAAPERAADIARWADEHSPSGVARNATQQAIDAYLEAVQEASQQAVEQSKARAKAAAQALKDAVLAARHDVELGLKAGTSTFLFGAGLAVLASVLAWKML